MSQLSQHQQPLKTPCPICRTVPNRSSNKNLCPMSHLSQCPKPSNRQKTLFHVSNNQPTKNHVTTVPCPNAEMFIFFTFSRDMISTVILVAPRCIVGDGG